MADLTDIDVEHFRAAYAGQAIIGINYDITLDALCDLALDGLRLRAALEKGPFVVQQDGTVLRNSRQITLNMWEAETSADGTKLYTIPEAK